jgi:4-carboxymuconolactone decarboxylase
MLIFVHMAALATLGAVPVSWLMNSTLGDEACLAPEQLLETLIAIAPVIGTARIVSAVGNIIKAFFLAGVIAGEAEVNQAEDGEMSCMV